MWNYLKQRLLPSVERKSVRRRAPLPQFRGQIERLETRAVLSTTAAAMPAEIEPIPAGEWETAHFENGWRHESFVAAARHEDHSPNIHSGDWRGELGEYDQPAWGPNRAGAGAFAAHGPVYVVTLIKIYVPPSVASVNASEPLRISAPMAATFSQPLAATSPTFNLNDEPTPQPPLMSHVQVDTKVGSFLSLLASFDTATDTSVSSSSTTSVSAREAAFEAYSSDLLLLTGRVEDWRDSDLDPLDGLTESVDQERRSSNGFYDFELHDEVAASFGTLESELNAFDEVLSELHEFEIRDDRSETDYAQDRRQSDSTASWIAKEGAPPENATEAAPSDLSAGGMVLLDSSGGANDCEYGLIAIFTSRTEEIVEMSPGAELSVGVYQAFEVGSNELPSNASSAAKVPAASSAARPSQSADSAPAKIGDRNS